MSYQIFFMLVFINFGSLNCADINNRIKVLTISPRALSLYRCSEQGPNVWNTPSWLQEPMSVSKWARLNETTKHLFKFNLKENRLHKPCNGDWVEEQISKDDFDELGLDPNSTSMEKHLQMGFYFTFYGYLRSGEYFVPTERFCIKAVSPSYIVVNVCLPECDKDSCIKKICPLGMVARFDVTTPKGFIDCIETYLDEWTPKLYKQHENSSLSLISRLNHPAVYYTFHGVCDDDNLTSIRHVSYSGAVYSQIASIAVTTDNKILTRKSDDREWEPVDSNATAIDGAVFSTDGQYLHHLQHAIVVHCITSEPSSNTSPYALLIIEAVFFALAGFLLLLVAVRYGFASKDINVNGWIVGTFCFFRFCVLLFEILEKQKEGFYTSDCIVIGVAEQFFRIAANIWFVIYAGDTWRTMRSKVPPYVLSKARKLFIGYFLTGIGIPTLITSISFALEFGKLHGILRPHYCDNRWTYSVLPFVFHTIVPSILVLVPSAVFTLLIVKSVRALEEDGIDETRSKQAKNFYKVVTLVKADWIFYLVIILVDPTQSYFWVWIVYAVFNLLESFALFWIFVFNGTFK